MARSNLRLWLAAVGAGFALGASARDPQDIPRVTFDGYGPVRIGMTTRELENVLGEKPKYPIDFEDESCRYADLGGKLQGASAMMIDNRLARIDFRSDTIKTLSGIGIGDTAARIMAAYPGRISREPHAYTAPDGSYYTLLSANRKRGIRFETDRGIVRTFYVGESEAIQYIEGCQ